MKKEMDVINLLENQISYCEMLNFCCFSISVDMAKKIVEINKSRENDEKNFISKNKLIEKKKEVERKVRFYLKLNEINEDYYHYLSQLEMLEEILKEEV